MKLHHGKIIEQKILEIGRKKIDIAKRLGITRQTLANKLKTPNLSIDFILSVGKILGYKFSYEIPELQQLNETVSKEYDEQYLSVANVEKKWKEKYMKLMEEYNNCLREKNESSATLIIAINELRKDLKRLLKKKD